MKAVETVTRGADKYNWVANEIRRRIAVGQLAPGSQLPQRGELEASFQVSKVTLQRAMNMLIEDGFIAATRSKGSFVAEKPPHLSRYALVFQGQPFRREGWSQFWEALANEAARRERENLCSVPVYYGIGSHTDTVDFQKLNRDITEHRLAGLIYVSNYAHPVDLSLVKEVDLPCVLIQTHPDPQAPSVRVSQMAVMKRALDYVEAQGCKRIAVLRPGGDAEPERYVEEITARGLQTYAFWDLGVGLESPQAARNCVHLLMHKGQTERPDAFIITDDNLVEPATLGLVDAGVKTPGDLIVVAHANFPWKTPSYVEAQRVGYDVRQIFSTCLESIDCQRRGETIPAMTEIPALLEEEFYF